MTYRIRLLELADGRSIPNAGEYLLHYSPNAGNGQGEVLTTPQRDAARAYPSTAAALEEVLRIADPPHDRRDDGQPNRPLTAFSIEIVPDHHPFRSADAVHGDAHPEISEAMARDA
jgi:hypothetical protein